MFYFTREDYYRNGNVFDELAFVEMWISNKIYISLGNPSQETLPSVVCYSEYLNAHVIVAWLVINCVTKNIFKKLLLLWNVHCLYSYSNLFKKQAPVYSRNRMINLFPILGSD